MKLIIFLIYFTFDVLSFTSSGFGVHNRLYRNVIILQENEAGHDVRSDISVEEIDEIEMDIQKRFMEHQTQAPRLGFATDVRSLIQYNHGFAVMSTNSKAHPGFPGGSVVGFAPDEEGRPIFIFSGMSSHTQDLLKDSRCSLTVAMKGFKGAADSRVNLLGNVKLVPPSDREACKNIYKTKHPNAFWADFGDFNWFRMEEIVDIRFVGGFARAGNVKPEEYAQAKPDTIMGVGPFIADHMNEDHMEATKAMISAAIPGLEVTEAVIVSVDSLGMNVKVKRTPRSKKQFQEFKVRLPFPRPVTDRKAVKDVIVEMTRSASKR